MIFKIDRKNVKQGLFGFDQNQFKCFQETLEALVLLPPASLFDQSNVSSVWMEVVERTSKFLRSVVMGDLSTDPGAVEIPSKDKNTALTLLLGMF